jgi:hypothetical protein
MYGSDDNGFHHIAFLNHTAGSRFFHGTNDYITDSGVASAGAAEYTDAHQLFRAGVISDFH